ncbi:hypothetical protein ACMFMG_006365 [Clarireedia jacksonii]
MAGIWDTESDAWKFTSTYERWDYETTTVEEYSQYNIWKKTEQASQRLQNQSQLLEKLRFNSHFNRWKRGASVGFLSLTYSTVKSKYPSRHEKPKYSADTWRDIHDWRNHPLVLASGMQFDTLHDMTNKLEQQDTILLESHLRQPGPPGSKLPTQLLYVCHESHKQFVRRYQRMGLIVPYNQSQVRLSDVCSFKNFLVEFDGIDRTVQCKISVNQKGYIDYRHDTLLAEEFRCVSGILSTWNGTKCDLSSVTSLIFRDWEFCFDRGLRQGASYPGEPSTWAVLETQCPNLRKLTLVRYRFSSPPNCRAVPRLIPMNVELLIEARQILLIDALQKMSDEAEISPRRRLSARRRRLSALRRHGVEVMAALQRLSDNLAWARDEYLWQAERNPAYWNNVSFEAGVLAWLEVDQMERVMVAPPPDERRSCENKIFWIERPKVVAPRLLLVGVQDWGEEIHEFPCHPDGTMVSPYEGIKEMFEGCL